MSICKYCWQEDLQGSNPLIFPCKCKNGVHLKCLGTWVFSSSNGTPRRCELCLTDYVGVDIPGVHLVSIDVSGNPVTQDASGEAIIPRRRLLNETRMLAMEGCCCCSFFINVISALITGLSDDYDYDESVRTAFCVTVVLGAVSMIFTVSCCFSRFIIMQRRLEARRRINRRAIMPVSAIPVTTSIRIQHEQTI